MRLKDIGVPKMKPHGFEFGNRQVTGTIPALVRVENGGVAWYNLSSRQPNVSMRHFNNLKSFRRHCADPGLGRLAKVFFRAYGARFN